MLIKIKFLSPTNSRGSRYKATIKDGENFRYSATVPSTYTSDNGDVIAAAEEVADKVLAFMTGYGFDYITGYDIKIVGSYDGDHYATMKPVYKEADVIRAEAFGTAGIRLGHN